MTPSLSVVIPVVQVKMAEDLIRQIENNTVTPDLLIIIDNSKDGFDPESKIPKIRIRRKDPPIWINEAWKTGITLSASIDLVSIFNDDIIIGPYLFEKIKRVMDISPRCAVVCPSTITQKPFMGLMKTEKRGEPEAEPMARREGWAFTIRRSVMEKIPPIPEELKIFFGDDWIWQHTRQMGHFWLKILNTYIFHYVGTSIKEAGIRKQAEKERRVYEGITGRKTKIYKDRK